MQHRTYDVMVAGHVCIDVIPTFPETGAGTIGEILRPGKLVQVEEAKISTGGPVSNTGIGLKLLGNEVAFNSRIGDDEFGRITLDLLRQRGNAEGIRVVAGKASSYTIALAPPGIDRIFLHNPGTNYEYVPGDLDPSLLKQCRHFHFGYPPLMRRMFQNRGEELRRVFQIAKEAGATTSCDMALPDPSSEAGEAPWPEILERVLPYVDIFLPSVEETLYMLERETFMRLRTDHESGDLIDVLSPSDYSRLAGRILELGSKMTALKTGHRGFYFRTADASAFETMGAARPADAAAWSARELWCPAFQPPRFGSATGSGDSSIAGFLTVFLKGGGLAEALKAANCLGWQNVQTLDALSGIRSWEETSSLLREGIPMIDIGLSADGWTWSEELKMWVGPNDSRPPDA